MKVNLKDKSPGELLDMYESALDHIIGGSQDYKQHEIAALTPEEIEKQLKVMEKNKNSDYFKYLARYEKLITKDSNWVDEQERRTSIAYL